MVIQKQNINENKNNKDYLYRLINIITSVTRKNNNIDTESFKYYFRANKKIITKLRLHKRILQDISQQYVPIPEHTT